MLNNSLFKPSIDDITSGMHVLFLPPYSPDYNPIELAFSAIKAYVRRWSMRLRIHQSNLIPHHTILSNPYHI
jgi:transposase